MKIYRTNDIDQLMHSYHSHFLPFDLERRKWQWSRKMIDCDVIPVINKSSISEIQSQIDYIRPMYNDQTILILNLFHVDESTDTYDQHNYQLSLWKELTENVIIVHTNLENKSNIFYDFLWNRQKCYFTEYDNFSLHNRVWTWGANIEMFQLDNIEKSGEMKRFVSPNRIYRDPIKINHPRIKARSKLKELLSLYDGYISDPQMQQILEPQQRFGIDILLKGQGGTWWPVANRYYNSSYISIYVETITTGFHTKTITEKTWDPLIKGHFILPYGYHGMINDILSYGFKLPEWIDYSYDQEKDDDSRWKNYERSVKNVLSKSLTEIDELYQKDKEILLHNRNVFFTRPYDTLYDKIKIFRSKHTADKNLS